MGRLDLRPGDWVEVRSSSEILATLDDNATLDGLMFMPEMLASCGRRFQVHLRADKTCDTIYGGMRRMERTVHLAGSRCDGESHGRCDAGCLLFWKEAWLRRSPLAESRPGPVDDDSHTASAAPAAGEREWLETRAIQNPTGDKDIRYRCQATELPNAGQPLAWWEPSQYLRDVYINKVPWAVLFRALAVRTCNKVSMILSGRAFPNLAGSLGRTPVENLGLQPGEWVVVKSKQEIRATLDKRNRNHGLSFDPEMLPFCGKRYRVLRRVERFVEEATGRLVEPRGVSVILDGVFCRSLFRRPCPRCIYSYWREIWLRRDAVDQTPNSSFDLAAPNSMAQVQPANLRVEQTTPESC